MQAAVGDRLHVHANVVGHPGRTGEIVEVRGAGGEPQRRRLSTSASTSCARELDVPWQVVLTSLSM